MKRIKFIPAFGMALHSCKGCFAQCNHLLGPACAGKMGQPTIFRTPPSPTPRAHFLGPRPARTDLVTGLITDLGLFVVGTFWGVVITYLITAPRACSGVGHIRQTSWGTFGGGLGRECECGREGGNQASLRTPCAGNRGQPTISGRADAKHPLQLCTV